MADHSTATPRTRPLTDSDTGHLAAIAATMAASWGLAWLLGGADHFAPH